MVKWFLFETRLGAGLLALFETWTGLAIVSEEWLGDLVVAAIEEGK